MIKTNDVLRQEEGEASTGGGLGGGIISETATESTPETSPDVDAYSQLLQSLPEELQNNPTIQNTKSFDALASQLVNAQSALGTKRLQAPQEDWGDEEWESFNEELRPKDGYNIPEEVSISEDFDDMELPQHSEEAVQELTDFANEAGLTQKQFEALFSRYTEMEMQGRNNIETYNKDTISKFGADMAEHWGNQFEVNMKQANETFDALSQEIPELQDLVNWSPVVANHPAVLKLFHKISEISGDALPAVGTNQTSPFGQDQSVQAIKAQIQELDTNNEQLIMTDPSSLSFADKEKREKILEKRIKLYSELYGN